MLQKHYPYSQKRAFSALRGKGAKTTASPQPKLSKKRTGKGKNGVEIEGNQEELSENRSKKGHFFFV